MQTQLIEESRDIWGQKDKPVREQEETKVTLASSRESEKSITISDDSLEPNWKEIEMSKLRTLKFLIKAKLAKQMPRLKMCTGLERQQMLDDIYLTFLNSTLDVAGAELANKMMSKLLIAQEMGHIGEWLSSIDE